MHPDQRIAALRSTLWAIRHACRRGAYVERIEEIAKGGLLDDANAVRRDRGQPEFTADEYDSKATIEDYLMSSEERKPEIYVSTDVETDGPIPGRFSMLAFGSAAFLAPGREPIAVFQERLAPLPGAKQNPETMAFWATQPEAWAWLQQEQKAAETVMPEYVQWLKGLPGKPVFVGYPATFDFMFVYWYLIAFAGESPFGFQGLDIKSYAAAMLKQDFRRTAKKSMPAEWFDESPHTHIPLDDAIEQGRLFLSMLAANR